MDYEKLRSALAQRKPGSMDGRPPCAVLVPLVRHNGEDCLLFELRAASLHWQPGEVCFPGGRMEPEETALECALRETREELGLSADHMELIGPMDYTMHASGFPVFPYLVRLQPGWEDILQLNADEVAEVFTIPLSYLRYNRPKTVRVERSYHTIDGLPEEDRVLIECPPRLESSPVLFWDYEDKLLWGMTARITEWLIRWLEQQR